MSKLIKIAKWMAETKSQVLSHQILTQNPAIIFAPHQDDETLGCGGTILMKRKAGQNIIVVYMTSEPASKETNIHQIRHNEALAACEKLNIDEKNVIFLDYPDGQLNAHIAEATNTIQQLLKKNAGYEIFIPSMIDDHPDHEDTALIVKQACENVGGKWTIWEFPVWLWDPSNYVEAQEKNPLKKAKQIFQYLKIVASRVNVKANIASTLQSKHQALDQHISQMTHEINHNQTTLPEIANGQWLKCFFSRHELFFKYIQQKSEKPS